MIIPREDRLRPSTSISKPRQSHCKGCGKDPSIQSILGLCARSEAHSLFYCRLVKEADQIKDWSKLPQQAEFHGLAPLAYTHLQAIDALLPVPVRREMQALYLRHRYASQVYNQALTEIMQACQHAAVEVLLLKGAALAQLVYPLPGLRPKKDVDILVRPSQAQQTMHLLLEMGYQASPPAFYKPETAFHLPPLTRSVKGMRVTVEIHTNLFPDKVFYHRDLFDRLSAAAQDFSLDGIPARTLGWEDMLWHVHGHTFGLPPQLTEEFFLIGVADLVSIVERFHGEIDWEKIHRQYPRLYHALPALHFLTPWSDQVIERMGFQVDNAPRGAIREYQGWPLKSRRMGKRQGGVPFLRETFFPSEWWLRVHYGSGGKIVLFINRWIRHPLNVLKWVVSRFLSNK